MLYGINSVGLAYVSWNRGSIDNRKNWQWHSTNHANQAKNGNIKVGLCKLSSLFIVHAEQVEIDHSSSTTSIVWRSLDLIKESQTIKNWPSLAKPNEEQLN